VSDCYGYRVAKASFEVARSKGRIPHGFSFGCIANEYFTAFADEDNRRHLGNAATEVQWRRVGFAGDGSSSEACAKVDAQCICAHLFLPVTKVPFVARRNLARVASRSPPHDAPL